VAFLNLNGYDFDVDAADTYIKFLSLADGSLSEEDLAAWYRTVIHRLSEK